MRAIIILFCICILVSCKKTKTTSVVYYSGALKTLMSGDISKKAELDSLSIKKNLYAIGALEGLLGEIQIFNSLSKNSRIKEGKVTIDNKIQGGASLLVYTQVEKWTEISSLGFASKKDLERLLIKEAKKIGLDTENPFPFLLEGKVSALQWHVIRWNPEDSLHTHKKHKESGLSGTIKNRKVVVLGFYSNKHKAVFTHHSSNIHMHFITKENSLAGHVDDLNIKGSITLKLPKL